MAVLPWGGGSVPVRRWRCSREEVAVLPWGRGGAPMRRWMKTWKSLEHEESVAGKCSKQTVCLSKARAELSFCSHTHTHTLTVSPVSLNSHTGVCTHRVKNVRAVEGHLLWVLSQRESAWLLILLYASLKHKKLQLRPQVLYIFNIFISEYNKSPVLVILRPTPMSHPSVNSWVSPSRIYWTHTRCLVFPEILEAQWTKSQRTIEVLQGSRCPIEGYRQASEASPGGLET